MNQCAGGTSENEWRTRDSQLAVHQDSRLRRKQQQNQWDSRQTKARDDELQEGSKMQLRLMDSSHVGMIMAVQEAIESDEGEQEEPHETWGGKEWLDPRLVRRSLG